jgi:hypothetical protein
MKIFKPRPILGILLLLLCGTFHVAGQTVECPSPQGCVLITREAALKALADADEVVALRAEKKVLSQASDDLKELLNKMRIEFAEKSGENTALKQNAVSDRAIIDILLKNVRPKKIGLINF